MNSTKKSVTTAQVVQIQKMAREKGVGRDQFQKSGLDNGLFALALDAVARGFSITIGIPPVAPAGGRVITIKAKTHLDREWQAAVNAAGPQTPDSYNVRKVGNLYLPTGTGVVEEGLILLNYPNGDGSLDSALSWAEASHLQKTDPRRVFAIGEGQPKFNYEAGPNPCYVVATEDCSFDGGRQACHVWWDGHERKVSLVWVSDYGIRRVWFAFRQ